MSSSRWPRKFWPLALLTRLLAGCVATQAAQAEPDPFASGEVFLYGKWAVGCSNLRNCTAIVPLSEARILEPPYYLEFRYSGNFADNDGFSIMREGETVAQLTPEITDKMTQDLRNDDGPELFHLIEGDRHFDVPQDGFADMMNALEEWRKRPPPAANSTDAVTPLPAALLQNPIPPLKIVGAAKRCPKNHMGQSLQAWRGIGGQTLWKAGCGNEGVNSVSFWYVAGPQGAPATEVEFQDRDGPATLYNSWFQAETGYLRSTHYFGRWDSYQEDCGIYRAYAWAAEGMKLVEQRHMPQCGTGIGPEGWPIVYRATILNGPDSGP
jgi:hypothetical protein